MIVGTNLAEKVLRGKIKDITALNGLSAYEVAVKNGFEGTEEEWLASLKGEPGEKGAQGDKGDRGAQGDPGANGEPGITPHIGENGNWYIGDTDTGIAADGSTKPTIASIAVTESADGSVTMVNTLEGGGTETLVISADANGNPSKLTYNGTEIPITWTEATATEGTEVTA